MIFRQFFYLAQKIITVNRILLFTLVCLYYNAAR